MLVLENVPFVYKYLKVSCAYIVYRVDNDREQLAVFLHAIGRVDAVLVPFPIEISLHRFSQATVRKQV